MSGPGDVPKPAGYKPGQTHAPLISDIATPICAIATSLVLLRLYVRTCLVKVVGKDDWLLLVAVIFLWVFISSSLARIPLGLGKHQYDLVREYNDPSILVPLCFVAILSFYVCQCCIQCSILAFYLRIGLGVTGGPHMRSIIHSVIGFSIFNNLAGITIHTQFTVMSLSPGFQSFKYMVPFWFAYGSCNLLIDLTIWALPIRSISSILHNLSSRKKCSLILTFAAGMLSWGSSILRLSCWRFAVDSNYDPAYNTPILTLFGVIEVCVAMSCVSLVTLRPLVVGMTKWFNRLRGIPTSTLNSKSLPTSTGNSKSLGCQSEQGPNLPQYGTGGFRTTGNKGRFGGKTVGLKPTEWEDNGLEIKPQAVQQACSQVQVPSPVAMSRSTTSRSSSSSDGETHKPANTATTIRACLDKHSWPPCDTRVSSESTTSFASLTSTVTDEAKTQLNSKDSKPLA